MPSSFMTMQPPTQQTVSRTVYDVGDGKYYTILQVHRTFRHVIITLRGKRFRTREDISNAVRNEVTGSEMKLMVFAVFLIAGSEHMIQWRLL
jgi:hypothetical protein